MTIDPNIFNTGLDLSMEWGEDWLEPINERLKYKFPEMSNQELDYYNDLCAETRDYCYSIFEQVHSEKLTFEDAQTIVLEKHPLINEKNLHRLLSQAMYYALYE